MLDSDFDRLMERYVKGDVSAHEREKIEAWLEVVKTDPKAERELTQEQEDRIFHKLTSDRTTVADLKAVGRRRHAVQWALRIAASLLILFVLSYVVVTTTKNKEDQLQVTATGDVEKVILDDGSLIWMRGNSTVKYSNRSSDGFRVAVFEGNALFEVAKDADHPFVVQCGDVRVKVLGTSFSLAAEAGRLELIVLTGSVHLTSETGDSDIVVQPLEKVVYTGDGKFLKTTIERQMIGQITTNTGYNMAFRNEQMSEVVKKIETKFDVKINMPNAQLSQCEVTADLTDRSLETSLQLLTEILNVEYAIQGNMITLTGKGCR